MIQAIAFTVVLFGFLSVVAYFGSKYTWMAKELEEAQKTIVLKDRIIVAMKMLVENQELLRKTFEEIDGAKSIPELIRIYNNL